MNANGLVTPRPRLRLQLRSATVMRIATLILAVVAVVPGTALVLLDGRVATHGEDLVVRCDQLSDTIGRRLAIAGVALNSPEWRRQKQVAFRACIDDYAAFIRLVPNP